MERTEGFSTDWFDQNIPYWEKWLESKRGEAGLRALEIGSFEGRSTQWLCRHILTASDSSIDCLDFFQVDPVYGDYHQRFLVNTALWRDRITEFAGTSFDSLRRVTGPYDIVYIDGWHSAFGALTDGVMAWPLLKVGGVMIFDDYLWVPPKMGPPPRPGRLTRKWLRWTGRQWWVEGLKKQIASVKTQTPKLGVDGLLATIEGHYELLGVSNQLALRKTRDFSAGQVGHDT
ncbi:class I SAM-dependent methyltransferase [Rhodanobacter ginsengiterrae]|uniref:class I SAM-dependent methyltransferase n=1 Tax=Rhodanobacter ginsengiterrae TaxID=2008451 RepID=UPI003CF5DC61